MMKHFLLLAAALTISGISAAELAVEIDFPGGSGEVVSIDQTSATVVLNPTSHPDRGWRCWWYFRLTGITPGEEITLDVGDAPWATPKRATFSSDRGITWQHSEKGKRNGKRIRYLLTFENETALIAWGPPFVPNDAMALVGKLEACCDEATAFTLCRTREGRKTPAVRIGTVGKPLIWVQARQHAWESGASWVGKGFAEWLVSDAPKAEVLRREYEVVFVPVIDIDNVHRGAGGKNQKPQDHNRDWSDAPHWNAVAAAQKELRAAAVADRLAIFIDLHNPGANDLFPYFYVPPRDSLSSEARENLVTFIAAAKKEMRGPLRFTGRMIESGAKYDPKAWTRISKNWVARLGSPAVSVTLETSWNTPASTTSGYETIGRQLGLAIARYTESEK